MDVNTFLAHATDLASRGTPADSRSAISRGYYAAHHAAIEFLHRAGVRVPAAGKAHTAAFNALMATPDPDIKQAGTELSTLHTRRNDADYEWGDPDTEQPAVAQDAVKLAWEIVAALQTCQRDATRLDALRQHFQTWVPAHGHRFQLTLVPT
jgi:hypothetical protein